MTGVNDFNARIVDEFRRNGGTVSTAGFGDGLILLHTVGARSGQPRINPLMALPDGDGWLVVGSAGGSPKTPAWVHNLRAAAGARVEVARAGEITELPVDYTELGPEAWASAWARFVDRSSGFASYADTAGGRHFPIFRLTPAAAG